MYKPNPKDTTNIQLSDDLLQLVEEIAENVHDVWAQGRMNEGWTYGEHRDDVLKKNPRLVPYAQLSEIEKEYDRNTAMETIKLVLSLGYKISK